MPSILSKFYINDDISIQFKNTNTSSDYDTLDVGNHSLIYSQINGGEGRVALQPFCVLPETKTEDKTCRAFIMWTSDYRRDNESSVWILNLTDDKFIHNKHVQNARIFFPFW